jgi:hypothetical protein
MEKFGGVGGRCEEEEATKIESTRNYEYLENSARRKVHKFMVLLQPGSKTKTRANSNES